MKKTKNKFYLVHVREVHIQTFQVRADNGVDAIRKVAEGSGDALETFEYSHTPEPETWITENIGLKEEGFSAQKLKI